MSVIPGTQTGAPGGALTGGGDPPRAGPLVSKLLQIPELCKLYRYASSMREAGSGRIAAFSTEFRPGPIFRGCSGRVWMRTKKVESGLRSRGHFFSGPWSLFGFHLPTTIYDYVATLVLAF